MQGTCLTKVPWVWEGDGEVEERSRLSQSGMRRCLRERKIGAGGEEQIKESLSRYVFQETDSIIFT